MNELAIVSARGEAYRAMGTSEKRIIATNTYVGTGVDARSSLTDHNGARFYKFTGVCLDAEHFGVGVATVLGRPHSFLMCHDKFGLCLAAAEAVRNDLRAP